MKTNIRSLLVLCIFTPGCSCSSSESTYHSESSYSRSNSDYDQEERVAAEPVNPYDDDSGHSAGYEWAQENDVSSCDGNSDSFLEGCEEYLRQRDQVDDEEENNDN